MLQSPLQSPKSMRDNAMPDLVRPPSAEGVQSIPQLSDLGELPELDGMVPDFHAFQHRQTKSLANARVALGATRWVEDLTRPSPPWLIPGFLQSQAIHVISAPKSARKTWLGLHTMLCGIYGTDWLGMSPSASFGSIYIAADSPRWDVRSQLLKLVRGINKPIPPIAEATSFLLPYGFKFTRESHTTAIAELVTAWNIRAIFVDVLLYSYDGLNENDNTDMGRLFQVIKFFRDNMGLAVVLLHHHAKDPTIGARGAGTILQAAEHHYELTRKGALTYMRREKLRGDEDSTWTSCAFSLEHTPNGGRVLTPTPESGDLIHDFLRAHPGTSRADIVAYAETLGRSARWTDGALASLRDRGRARSVNGVWTFC